MSLPDISVDIDTSTPLADFVGSRPTRVLTITIRQNLHYVRHNRIRQGKTDPRHPHCQAL
jgi:hypothetical protein